MAKAFGFYADNIVTRDYLDAVLRAGFGEQEQRFEQVEKQFEQVEKRFAQVDTRLGKLDARLEKLEPLRTQATLHAFMLGLIMCCAGGAPVASLAGQLRYKPVFRERPAMPGSDSPKPALTRRYPAPSPGYSASPG